MLLLPHLGIGLDDMFQYDMIARSLASGNGFRWYAPADVARLAPYLNLDVDSLGLDPRGMPTTFRAPLYPGMVALVYMIFGAGAQRFLAVRILQAFLGASLAPMTYIAGRRILVGDGWQGDGSTRAARIAAVAVAAYPSLIMYPLGLATENLFFPLLLAGFLALLSLPRGNNSGAITSPGDGKVAIAILAGVLLGLAALTRSVILPFAFAAIVWIWMSCRRPKEAAIAVLAAALTITPWIIRNSELSGRFTGIETSMGYNLYLGYHPDSTGTFKFGPSLDLMSILEDRTRDAVGTQRAIEFVRQEPGRFGYLALRRLGHFFDLEWRAFTYFYSNGLLGLLTPAVIAVTLILLALPFVLIASLAAFGAAMLPKGATTGLLALLLVMYLLPHVFILSEERFHLALVPVFSILAAAAWERRRGWTSTSVRRLWLSAVVVVLLVVNWSFQIGSTWPTMIALLGPGGNQLHLPY